MSRQLIKYDGVSTYVFPNGSLATPAKIMEEYPAIIMPGFFLEVDGSMLLAYHHLGVSKKVYGIADDMPENEAVEAIQNILNNPQIPIDETPSAEDRIAAALELNNLLQMEDVVI